MKALDKATVSVCELCSVQPDIISMSSLLNTLDKKKKNATIQETKQMRVIIELLGIIRVTGFLGS